MKFINYQSKIISRFVLLAFVSLSLAGAGFAQGKINIAEQVSLVKEFDVNGLKVLVKRRSNAPTVAAGLFIRGGARNITDKNAGIESLTLNVALEGSKKYPKEIIRRKLAETGSQLAAGVTTDYSVLNFASTRQDFDETWKLFTDVVTNPTFAENDVERIRQQIVTALREEETDNDDYLEILQSNVIYKDHPYANRVGGTIETIQNLTPQDLKNYHKKIMQTSQLLLVVVGDIDADDLQKKVSETLGKLPRGNYADKEFSKFDFTKGTLDVVSRPIPTNYIRGVFDAPSIKSPDYYAMRVAVTILRDRLFQEVRVNRQLSYAPSAGLDTFAANTANIYVTAVDANKTIKVMLDEINKLKREPVSDEDISGVSGLFLTSHFLDQETNIAQAAELAKYELIGGGWKTSFDFFNRLVEVTPKDVQAASRKYMTNLRFVVIGDPAAIDKEIFLQKMDDTQQK